LSSLLRSPHATLAAEFSSEVAFALRAMDMIDERGFVLEDPR
jgi:hypothetical protein